MSKKQLVLTDPAEAAVVDQIQVRLVRPEEQAEWDRLMEENHYLKSAQMVGEQLRYVAEYQGRWMALLGWSAAAYHLKGREGWIGWEDNQRCARGCIWWPITRCSADWHTSGFGENGPVAAAIRIPRK
jgi:hypothetical protein